MGDVTRQDARLEGQRPQYVRAVDGTALGEQIDDAEISERKYDAENQPDDDDRYDHRQNDLVVAGRHIFFHNNSSFGSGLSIGHSARISNRLDFIQYLQDCRWLRITLPFRRLATDLWL